MDEPATIDESLEVMRAGIDHTLDDIVRSRARKMLIAALEAEVAAHIQAHHLKSCLPHYLRCSLRLESAVPILYLRGLSTGLSNQRCQLHRVKMKAPVSLPIQ